MQLNNTQEAVSNAASAQRFSRFLSPSLQLAFMGLLASCTVPNQMPSAGYRLTSAQAAAAAIQAPRGPAYSLDHAAPVQASHSNAPITTLTEANAIAESLAYSYTQCSRAGVVLDVASLRRAQHDFKRVTIYGNTYGQGESPSVPWDVIRDWLGMGKWEADFITEQTRKNQARLATTPIQRQQHVAHPVQSHNGLYRSSAEANKPMPWYANVQPRGFYQHVVQSGQTFSGICEVTYRVDRRVVKKYNPNIHNPNVLHPGDVIQIPMY